ncbi:CoA-transferase [Geobacter argillaceus]|uniref:Acyl CoA:acetate/3-ketoacid CoA transferase alpha subunit n=1 Tax=Geobacter argillaceus TaxID=345631 RepID=A0A562VI10_9BACT|nr:CoA-transferase [Geobacter argillaceus]TWJ17357.1 acyl CoA:acetate/3-ketoacid CoA transferase alpha subunit [Geobacter argillaceus]
MTLCANSPGGDAIGHDSCCGKRPQDVPVGSRPGSKLVSLSEAVSRAVRQGDQIIFSFSHNRPHAAAFEVARQFRDSHSLELVGTGLIEYASVLYAAGAVRRMQSAFLGNSFPSPAPARVLGEAIANEGGHDPHWTNLTLPLRLMAGAMGWPFVPVRSLMGSDLGTGEGRAVVDDPFGSGPVQVISALVPDVAFVHGVVADTLGNTVVYGPDGEDLWGAWAARRVVVTAEKVISPEEFRRLGHRPGLPGNRVAWVSEVPYGAHPQAVFVWNDDGVRPYAEDYPMRAELRRLSRDPAAMRAWVEEWVFNGTHETYLARLGNDRLEALHAAALAVAPEEYSVPDGIPTSPEECAAVLAMRETVARVEAGSHDMLFAGIGLSHIAAWAAEDICHHEGLHAMLVAETGLYGFRPAKGDPYLFNPPNTRSSLFHSDFIHTLGVLGGPTAERCLTLLGAGQMDRKGNINSSMTANGTFLVGSGGANDLVNGNSDYMVVMPAGKGRLLDSLPFRTSPVGRLVAVATDLGLLELSPDSGDLEIAAVIAEPDRVDQTVAALVRACGWPVKVRKELRLIAPPTPEEVSLLRSFDPERKLLG